MSGKREDLEIVIGASLDGLASDLGKAAAMVKGLAKDVERVQPRGKDLAPPEMAGGYNRASRAARAAAGSFRAAAADVASFAGKAAVAGVVLAGVEKGFAGIGDVLRHVKESVSMAAEFEQQATAFEVMQGGAERAAKTMADLRRFAADTPFSSAETMKAAKLLTGMGTAADDLIPTLKLLGHHASIDPKNAGLERMAFLWGTMATSGRVYTRDLNQLTTAGINVFPALAKQLNVAEHAIRQMAEEGQLDFADVGRAMQNMTREGGPLFGLLEKQANTLTGSWEQMTDAFDLAKLKLGKILVEELNLKGMVKDLEHFAHGLEGGIDTRGLRDTIRFAGEVVRGIAQVSYEFTKAGVQSAGIFGEMAGQLPGMRETLRDIDAIVKGMQEFKLDPGDVARIAISLSKEVLASGGELVALIAEMGDAFYRNVLEPIVKTLREIRGTKEDMDNRLAVAGAVWEMFKPSAQVRRVGEQLGMMDRMNPAAGQAAQAAPLSAQSLEREAFESMRRFGESLRKLSDNLDRSGDQILRRLNAEKEATRMAKVMEDANAHERNLETLKQVLRAHVRGEFGSLMAMNPVSPLAGLAGGSVGFRREFDKLNAFAAMGGGAMGLAMGGLPKGDDLQFPDRPRQNVLDLAQKLNDQFDPIPKLTKFKADLDDAMRRGLIDKAVHDRGWADEVRGAAERLGMGPSKLPDAALAGSQEDARILANFMANNRTQTTEDLLRQIADYMRQVRDNTKEANRDRPVVADFGGGGDF